MSMTGLLGSLQNQFSLANAPNTAPGVGDPNGLTGLLQTTGIPMTQNAMQMRTPDYMSMLGQMGQQPLTPGYQPPAGGVAGGGTSDYLSRVLAGANTQSTNSNSIPSYSNAAQLYGNDFARWLSGDAGFGFSAPSAPSPFTGGLQGAYDRYLDTRFYNGGG